jgi:hypothetical protein
MIYRKDDKADQLVKIYLSFFSLYRVVKLVKKIDGSVFKTINSPADLERVAEQVSLIKSCLSDLLQRYLPRLSQVPLCRGVTWLPTWKSLPTYKQMNCELRKNAEAQGWVYNWKNIQSCFPAFMFELSAYTFLIEMIHSQPDQWSSGCLWPHRARYAKDPANQIFSGTDLDVFERTIGPWLPHYRQLGLAPICGRLGSSVEGGGKRRIFAIGNYVNQRLLKPVHDWLMEVLKMIPMDGTFDQEKPLDRLVGQRICYSFDLKSATDRWPLYFLFEVMQVCFDRSFASAVVNSALAYNIFDVPFVKRRPSTISFVAGQPLGYYSSWPLFALSHHILVWWCAEQVHRGQLFDRYAVLGDDVVVADREVAQVYERALGELGVTISYQKSLISDTGSAEFAKRFRVRDLTKDLSPVSIRSLMNFYHPYGLMAIGHTYTCARFSTLCRVGGAGFRQLARLDHRRSLRFERVLAMQTKTLLGHGGFELWLGRGVPLNPYLRGWVIDLLRKELLSLSACAKEMKPKDLRLIPDELFVHPNVRDFQEYSTLRGWVREWLRYCHWYFCTAMQPGVRLNDFFDAPIVGRNWQADRRSEESCYWPPMEGL